jgi:hypothetical protein
MIFNVRPRTIAAVSTHWSSYIVGCRDAALVCYFGLENLKRKKKSSSVGHFDNKLNTSEKKILVTIRTPSNIVSAVAVSREKLPLASPLPPVSLPFRV